MSHVTFDVETTGLDPRADRLKLVCFSKGIEQASLKHPEDREEIQHWLSLDCDYIAHNATFDLAFLEHNDYQLPPPERWRDTTLVAHIGYVRLPGQVKLDQIIKHHIREGRLSESVLEPEERIKKWLSQARRKATKEKKKRKPQKGDAPMKYLQPYCIMDVALTQWIAQHYGKEVQGQDRIMDLEHRVLPAIYDTQRRGVPVDLEAAAEFRREVRAEHARISDRMKKLAEDEDFNPQAPVQIAAALERRDVKLDNLPKTPKSGAPSLNAATLETIDDDLAQSILALREVKKMIDYADALFTFSHDGRLYGTFRQVGTTTGRMSSGQPNLQNIPAEDSRVRYLFRTLGNKVFVGADLDNMEFRMLAHLAPGGTAERAFKEGQDLHQVTADGVGITRREGKTLNYAILYGAGINKIATTFKVSHERANEIINQWYETYPEVRELKDKIARTLDSRGYVPTLLGRRHKLDKSKYYLSLNYVIQGGCADLFKLAVAELYEAKKPAVLYVHDEIVLEVDEDEAEKSGEFLALCMSSGAGIVEGLVAEANSAKRWSELK